MSGLRGTLYATDPQGATQSFPAGTARGDLPSWIKVDDGAFDTESDTGDGDGDGDDGYESQTVGELKDEIDSRNEGRDEGDKLSRSGNKSDLVETLEADDESADE